MKPIHLGAQQRQELQHRRHQTLDKYLYERLSAVLWAADGKSPSDIADLLGQSDRQVTQWLRLFRDQGLEALCLVPSSDDPRPLRPDDGPPTRRA